MESILYVIAAIPVLLMTVHGILLAWSVSWWMGFVFFALEPLPLLTSTLWLAFDFNLPLWVYNLF